MEVIWPEINMKSGKLVDREQTMTQGGRKKKTIISLSYKFASVDIIYTL